MCGCCRRKEVIQFWQFLWPKQRIDRLFWVHWLVTIDSNIQLEFCLIKPIETHPFLWPIATFFAPTTKCLSFLTVVTVFFSSSQLLTLHCTQFPITFFLFSLSLSTINQTTNITTVIDWPNFPTFYNWSFGSALKVVPTEMDNLQLSSVSLTTICLGVYWLASGRHRNHIHDTARTFYCSTAMENPYRVLDIW